MGVVISVLQARWWSGEEAPPAERLFPGMPGHELAFLDGLKESLTAESATYLPLRRKAQWHYAVPEFLENAGYEKVVNIAVSGNSGVGKSLFINTVRGVKQGQANWAPVGVKDTTKEPVWYAFPKNEGVRLWDLAGADVGGTGAASSQSSAKSYIRSIGLRYFDVVLVFSAGRLTETDIELANELVSHDVPFFFVRTKVDWDIENSEADYGISEEETKQHIMDELRQNGIQKPYLINAREPKEHDMPRLIRDVAVVVTSRWPELMSAEVSKSEPGASEAGEGQDEEWDVMRGDPIQPVDELLRLTGRWAWHRDEGFYDFLKGEAGEMAATAASMILGAPEHTYTRTEPGTWIAKVANNTGTSTSTMKLVNENTVVPDSDHEMFGKAVRGMGRELVVGGKRLRSEFKGVFKDDMTPIHIRMDRMVVNDEYVMVWVNMVKRSFCKRFFRRFPHYEIQNDTGQVVTLSTYSQWSLYSASMTVEVEPGTHHVSCSSKSPGTEKAIFKLPDKRLHKLPEVEPLDFIKLKDEDFVL